MKGHVADESLSEETRESAQKALDALVSSQADVIKLESEQNAVLKKRELEAQFKLKQLEATKQLDVGIEAEMVEWLEQNRLLRHAETITRVAGADAAPSDLQFLTEEDTAEIADAMTNVEKKRLEAALEALRDEGQGAESAESERE